MKKNNIFIPLVVFSTFIIICFLCFALINRISSSDSLFDDFADLFESSSVSDDASESSEDVENGVQVEEKIKVDLLIKKYDPSVSSGNSSIHDYNKISYFFNKGESYSITVPDYSQQGYYAMSDYNISGVAISNTVHTVVYTSMTAVRNFDPTLTNYDRDTNIFSVYFSDEIIGSEYEFIELKNTSPYKITDPMIKFYRTDSFFSEPYVLICSNVFYGYSIGSGDSLLVIPNNLNASSSEDYNCMILGQKTDMNYRTYDYSASINSSIVFFNTYHKDLYNNPIIPSEPIMEE